MDPGGGNEEEFGGYDNNNIMMPTTTTTTTANMHPGDAAAGGGGAYGDNNMHYDEGNEQYHYNNDPYHPNQQHYYDDGGMGGGGGGVGGDGVGGDGDVGVGSGQYDDTNIPSILLLNHFCAHAFPPQDDSDEAKAAADRSWDPVRDWMRSHSAEEVQAAAEQRDDAGKTALHFACQSLPPKDIIDVFLSIAVDTVQWPDSFGWLPIHYACRLFFMRHEEKKNHGLKDICLFLGVFVLCCVVLCGLVLF